MNQSYPEAQDDCPCQSGLPFEQCCQCFLNASLQSAETAEQLMRSRYCAYVISDSGYLLKTWHPEHRPTSLNLDDSDLYSKKQWIGLKIKNKVLGAKNDIKGQIHFIARYKINGKAHKLEENSFFEKINGQWFYLTGDYS